MKDSSVPQIKGISNAERARKLFEPIGAQICVQIVDQKQSSGGILIPSTVKPTNNPLPPLGWVIAAGPKCEQFKDGDLAIVPPKLMALVFIFERNRFLVLKEEDAWGRVTDPAVLKEYA